MDETGNDPYLFERTVSCIHPRRYAHPPHLVHLCLVSSPVTGKGVRVQRSLEIKNAFREVVTKCDHTTRTQSYS
jgi:hypothetical protein